MSGSVLLYLAIVVMWLCVLVPMWLRRDRPAYSETDAESGMDAGGDSDVDADAVTVAGPYGPAARASENADVDVDGGGDTRAEPPAGTDGAGSDAPAAVPGSEAGRRRAERRRRAVQVAKRRRLTLWCVLLLLASVVTAATRVIPWWGIAPSVVLLGGYLTVLRAAVKADAERRRAAALARAERARRARRRAELEARRPVAEVIDLTALRDELFDQYAETPRRAVGD
ncbi:hypothetical protein ACFYSC_05780 [Streptosporangium sp. NPDC004379]|uniref:divisome protein SepX/GlpR n=1 Tax=Streptosporangium sp. NPDC004379 TaxID=3366189 RepID=UPI003682A502